MTRPLLALHSRFAQRVRRRYESQLHLLASGLPTPAHLKTTFEAFQAAGEDTASALRMTRALVLERLLCLDCEGQADLGEVTQAMTELAEFALNQALSEVLTTLDKAHGPPLTDSGQRADLWIVGMGKLGARELNVSSDIDLIYIYDEDGDTAGNTLGRGRITNHEYFGKAVRGIYALVGETTEHGFVFRVDLALRPNGNSGPAAVSLDALEHYLHVQGREWERFAWLKSRVVAPWASVQRGTVLPLRQVVTPFVFRRYLDYSVFDALRLLHRQIRDHASKRSAGRPERANDVKLSRGGIREIEFIVQLLQVVRGGQYPELRTRPTLKALPCLVKANLMPSDTAEALAQAYTFLRQVEHRIQYLDDQQTHILPTQDADLAWIASTLGFASPHHLLQDLDSHRELVAQEFDKLLGGGAPECKGCQNGKAAESAATMSELLPQLGDAFRQRLESWLEHPRVLALREEARARLMRLLSRTAQWVRENRVSEAAAVGLVDWMEPLLRRESYLALLLERPNVHERLLHLLGAARWPARYLLLHPGVIDELAGATAAGHIIECGTQATGGNFSFFTELPDLVRPGFPIAEIAGDGSCVITKHPGTGGAVTVETVVSQLLYEVTDARYAGPDVTLRLDSLRLASDGPDRVRVFGARGEAPPPDVKVSCTRVGGYRNEMTFVLTGLDIEAKADLTRRQFEDALGAAPAEVSWALARTDRTDADSEETASARLTVVARDPDPARVAWAFSGAAVEIALGGIIVRPGDVICADDDGVVVVERQDAPRALARSTERLAKEDQMRERLQAGELGVDIYGLRQRLIDLGVDYVD